MLKRRMLILGMSTFFALASTAAEARQGGGQFWDWLQQIVQQFKAKHGHGGGHGGGWGHCR